jgi:predicted CXXCH cytochrome family protein
MNKGAGRIWLAAPILLLLMASAIFAPAATKGKQADKQKPAVAIPATPPSADDFVGPETCGDCHAAEMEQLKKTAMSVLLDKKNPFQRRGCEACHGPGRKHAEAMGSGDPDGNGITLIYNLARHSAKDIAGRCLTCHQKDEKPSLFQCSRHLAAGVSCIDCHDPHRLEEGPNAAKAAPVAQSYFTIPKRPSEKDWLGNRLLRQNEPFLCYSCHKEIQAEFQLPIRHRVNEGLLKCTDCHNPMGTLNSSALKATGTDVCFSCHVEKRGPYVYEHASVRVEGCTGCHTPHGSINLHLLKRRQERQLCLECHANPQAINVPHPRLGFQEAGECTRCHVEIHGSNYQPDFLR